MKSIDLKIINRSSNPLPAYETAGSSGMDIRANLEEPITINSLERCLIPTGLFLEIPQGFEAQIRPRSGLAINHGLTCLNTPGTIDADYRGEIKIIIVNLSNEPHIVKHGDRIAQMIFQEIIKVSWKKADEISSTERGAGGFGHTGKN